MSSRLPASASAAALLATASHSSGVRGAFSSVPAAVTVVLTAPNTVLAAGSTMPRMMWRTDATGASAGCFVT